MSSAVAEADAVSVPGDDLVQEFRFDFGRFNPKVEQSEEGFVIVKGTATRTGVFPYRNPDGSWRFELRHPDDVLNEDSLKTLAGKPVTLEHPPEMVSPKNAKKHSVGSVSNRVTVVGDGLIEVVLNVHDGAAIQAMDSREKVELSCGYRCDVIEEAGVYDGMSYTHRQRNIRYNHLAIVEQGRAGRDAKLHLDECDGICVAFQVSDSEIQSGDGSCSCMSDQRSVNTVDDEFSIPSGNVMAQITIDGATYEADAHLVSVVAPKIQRLDNLERELTELKSERIDSQSEVLDLQKQIEDLEEERDRLQGRVDALDIEVEDLRYENEDLKAARTDSAQFEDDENVVRIDRDELDRQIEAKAAAIATERADALEDARELLSTADVSEIKLDASMSPHDIRKAVVSAMNPDLEISDADVSGFYLAMKAGANRGDAAAKHHADKSEEAMRMAMNYGGKDKKGKKKMMPGEEEEPMDMGAYKKRSDGYKKPLAMSKRMGM